MQIDSLTSVPACRKSLRAESVQTNSQESLLLPPVELHRLEKKISTIETFLGTNQNLLISPPSYAEKMKFIPNTIATMSQRLKYPQKQTLLINGDDSRDVLSGSFQQKTMNHL